MADRLKVDNKYIEGFIKEKGDALDILKLKSDGERTDYFMIALALGVDAGVRTPSQHGVGLILESVVRGKEFAMSFIYSIALQELIKEGRERDINDKDIVYGIAEEYANTGFKILDEMIPDKSKYDEEALMYSLIGIMDEKMESIDLQQAE